MSKLYNRIEEMCQQHGISITDMCRESGAPRGSLTDLKMGRTSSLTTNTLTKIATFFNAPMDYFLRNDPAPISNVTDSVILQGNVGNNTVTNGASDLTEQERELLRIFRSLDMRKKTAFLSYGYDLEDGK